MKKIWFTIVLICSLLVFTYQHSLAVDEAAEPSDTDSIAEAEVETETATFSNPAQAAHAANLSAVAAAALDGNVESAEKDVATAETGLREAQTDLNTTRAEVVATEKELEAAEANLETTISYRASVKSAYDALSRSEQRAAEDRYTNAMNQAREDVVAAEIALEEAEADLAAATGDRKEARADRDVAEAELAGAQDTLDKAVSELAGVSVEAISDMRESKMGWGQIAHELGVHRAALGLGKTKGYTNRHRENKRNRENIQIDLAGDLPTPEIEIAEATKRDIQHGWNNKGHGMATSVASSSKKGLGLSETDLGVGSRGSKASQGNSGSKSTKSSKSSSAGSSKSSSASSSALSSTGSSKNDRSSAGGPSNDKGNSGNSSSGASKSDRSSTGGPSNDKSNNGNSGNDKSDKSNNGNKGGNSENNGKSK